MLRISFINPPHTDWCLPSVLSYLYFQSHYKRHGKYPDQIEWVPAAYKFNRYTCVEEILDELGECDIYLMSSYIWNYDICDNFAKLVKKKYPNAMTVLGGPQIGTHDPSFLLKRYMYDLILSPTKPGEVFMQELLDSYIDNDGKVDPKELSWELRSKKSCSQFMPDYSVYADHLDFLKEMRQHARDEHVEPFMVIETTRGCPYKCTYCEWGGGVGSKIYKKEMDVIDQDIAALKEAGYRDVYLADANFGAFRDRDVEIFRRGFENGVNFTEISTMKSRQLGRRIDLIDAWFEVVGPGPEKHSKTSPRLAGYALDLGSDQAKVIEGLQSNIEEDHYVGIIPTVSIQSVSDEAMKVAKRADLSLENKIKLSEHIRKRCHEEGYPVPAMELILGMPGSTLGDFYTEWELMWNFKSWESVRHDYMFLPDTELTDPAYLKEHNIKLVEVYSDLIDESEVDNQETLYRNKRNNFKTISSCYSFTFDEMCQMHIMNIAENILLQEFYEPVESYVTPSQFGRHCWEVMQLLPEFNKAYEYVQKLLDPDTPPQNIKRFNGEIRSVLIKRIIEDNNIIIASELLRRALT